MNGLMKTYRLILLLLFICCTSVYGQQNASPNGSNSVGRNVEYVDLNLTSGTLWATCNIGANSPEEYGDYFAWGETAPKKEYSWKTYKWCKGRHDNIIKYSKLSNWGDNGFTDSKTILDLEDDAAYVIWGSNWHIPSYEQQRELIGECRWYWTVLNGVTGYRVVGKNGKSIFLPAAGCYRDDNLADVGKKGYYWSCSLDDSRTSDARQICIFEGFAGTYDGNYTQYRSVGRTIRPVRVK